jgi:hypothetical protein
LHGLEVGVSRSVGEGAPHGFAERSATFTINAVDDTIYPETGEGFTLSAVQLHAGKSS